VGELSPPSELPSPWLELLRDSDLSLLNFPPPLDLKQSPKLKQPLKEKPLKALKQLELIDEKLIERHLAVAIK
jgi:hypothetical protein